jgi:hypothetical protein
MSDLMLDVDQAGELKAAFRRGNWNNAEIKGLCEGDVLAQVRDVLRGVSEIKMKEHVVDLGADAVIPKDYNWTIEEHRKGNPVKLERKADGLYIDGKKIDFYLSKKQKKGSIVGNDLRVELKDQSVLNANVLDYLLKNPHLIPEEWKKDEDGNTRYIFFWGTIFRFAVGDLRVRCLYWYDGQWVWSYYWLGYYWNSNYPAAVSAS